MHGHTEQKNIIRTLIRKLYKPPLQRYLSKERNFRYKDLSLKIFPGVFHPGFFFSTKLMLHFLESFNLQNKKLLDLGSGSGLLALVAAKKGAAVTASDISMKAVNNISLNAMLNSENFPVINSDLFDQ